MPIAKVNGFNIHYEITGPANAPALVLSNSLGSNFGMWDAQMPELAKTYRVLRYDTRGHGKSEVTPGPYSFDQLARDVLALADSANIDKFSFCGLSMGGVTAMWLAIHASKRLQKLVVCSTGAKIGNAETWNARIEAVRKGGTKSIAATTMERWFTARFREREPQTVERIKKTLENTNAEGYIACCAALRDADFRDKVASISVRSANRWQISGQANRRCSLCRARCRPPIKHRAARPIHPRGAQFLAKAMSKECSGESLDSSP
jgi:3-oxoadipate enol-lactonase